MKRCQESIDLEKYYGERKYKKKQVGLEKICYSKLQKDKISMEIFQYIRNKDYHIYHDLMDDICESNPDWFNLLTFDKESRKFILTYLKSKNSSSYR